MDAAKPGLGSALTSCSQVKVSAVHTHPHSIHPVYPGVRRANDEMGSRPRRPDEVPKLLAPTTRRRLTAQWRGVRQPARQTGPHGQDQTDNRV